MIGWLIAISMLNAVCAVPMALRVRREYARNGRLSWPTAAWAGVTGYVHLGTTFALALLDRGSLSESSLVSLVVGFLLAMIGSLMIAAARREFSERADLYGMSDGGLVTSGIYRYSRHPQYLGIWLTLLGVATAGLSQWAMVLAFGFALGIHFYVVVVEEPQLRSSFGEKYLDYCRDTRRYL